MALPLPPAIPLANLMPMGTMAPVNPFHNTRKSSGTQHTHTHCPLGHEAVKMVALFSCEKFIELYSWKSSALSHFPFQFYVLFVAQINSRSSGDVMCGLSHFLSLWGQGADPGEEWSDGVACMTLTQNCKCAHGPDSKVECIFKIKRAKRKVRH